MGLEEIAAEVGRLFGTTQKHAQKWLEQRQTLLEALGTVRDKSDNLMSQLLGGGVPSPFGKKKRGKTSMNASLAPFSDTPRKRKGRRKMSEETRAKMRAAAQKRWAGQKKALEVRSGVLRLRNER